MIKKLSVMFTAIIFVLLLINGFTVFGVISLLLSVTALTGTFYSEIGFQVKCRMCAFAFLQRH